MRYSQKQRELLESFDLDPQQMTTYQVFATINWLKKKNPDKKLIDKLKARLDGRSLPKHPTKPVGYEKQTTLY